MDLTFKYIENYSNTQNMFLIGVTSIYMAKKFLKSGETLEELLEDINWQLTADEII